MPKQYACLAEVTVGAGGAASIDFNSIPQTYTDLIVKISTRSTATGGPESYFVYASFNGLTTNRTYRRLEAYGGGVGSDSASNYPVAVTGGSGGTTSTFNNGTFYIPNYSSSTIEKTYSADWASENNSTTSFDIGFIAGIWNVTSAITSISLTISTGNMAQYSTVSLYGITNS